MRSTTSRALVVAIVVSGCASRQRTGYAVGGAVAAIGLAAATYTLAAGCSDGMDGGGKACTALGLSLSLPIAFAGSMIVVAAARDGQVDSKR